MNQTKEDQSGGYPTFH